MQRVRIGLTGLAFVFLAVLLATIVTGDPAGEAPITPNLLEQQAGGSDGRIGETPADPAEPLAELGVAPGKAESNTAAPKAAPPRGRPSSQ